MDNVMFQDMTVCHTITTAISTTPYHRSYLLPCLLLDAGAPAIRINCKPVC